MFKFSFPVSDVPGVMLRGVGSFKVASGHGSGVSGWEGKCCAQRCSKACDLNIPSLFSASPEEF